MAQYYPVRAVIDIEKTQSILHQRILQAVNQTALNAYDKANDLVPVRKVFKYRRRNVGSNLFAEQLAQGRQDVRAISLEEALSESVLRRRLFLAGKSGADLEAAKRRGVGSAFPTDAAGRRTRGSQPLVRTAQLTESFSARSRTNPSELANREIARIDGQNRIVQRQSVFEERVRGRHGETVKTKIAEKFVPDFKAESLLSSAGRAELRRATGNTLGGALKKSLTLHRADDGSHMTALITVGNKDVDYAKYVELGTRRSRAQPFMRPALAQAREEYPELLRAALKGESLIPGKG